MRARGIFSQFDRLLFASALLLSLLGLVGIHSAQGGSGGAFLRQLVWIGLGLGACFFLASLDYHFLVDHALFLYSCSVSLLVALLFFGTEINGSRSWLRLAGFQFQPSEMVKLVVILALARYLGELNQNHLRRHHLLAIIVIAALPATLIVLQGDLGTALIFAGILVGMMVVAGLRARVLVLALGAMLLVTPAVWYVLKDYQRQRILVTLDPARDPQGVGYQTRQSQIAIGSGGILGKGLGHGLQSRLGFVPEVRTDFIFALLTEEIGFLGAILILMLYLLLLNRLLSIAEQARDRVGILVATGVASLIFVHVLVNVGMVLGVLPPVGIPLPLLSYGGSFTLTTFAALGLAFNVHSRRFYN